MKSAIIIITDAKLFAKRINSDIGCNGLYPVIHFPAFKLGYTHDPPAGHITSDGGCE